MKVDRPLRILNVAENYPPEYGGGAAIYLRDLCQVLAARGNDVRVVATESTDGPEYSVRTRMDGSVRVDSVNLRLLRSSDPDGWTLGLRRWKTHQARVRDVLRGHFASWRPDIVQYHTCRPLGEAAVHTLAELGVPIVAMLHDAWLICARMYLLRSPTATSCRGPSPRACLECMYSHYDGSHTRAAVKLPWRLAVLGAFPAYRLEQRRRARAKVDAAFGYSRYMAEVCADHLASPVRFIPLGIDLTGWPRDPNPFSRPRDPLRFGFIGGAQPSKGLADILIAVRALRAEGLPFEVHVWGPGEAAVSQLVDSAAVSDRVRFRGVYAASEMPQVFAEMDVAIMATTVSEPFGRVPQEAAAAGAPTIAPRVGGITEQIDHGSSGLLFAFKDPTDLAAQMRRILVEPGLIHHLIRHLPPVPDSHDAMVAVELFLREVLANHQRRS